MAITVRTGSIAEAVTLQDKIPELDNGYTSHDYEARLSNINHIILIAEDGGVPIGFKVGYDRYLDGKVFYSWLGAVIPDYRNQGVANLLLQKMVVWCKIKGYQQMKFKTLNKHRSMIRFAVNQGFNIVGFQQARLPEDSKIYFQKAL